MRKPAAVRGTVRPCGQKGLSYKRYTKARFGRDALAAIYKSKKFSPTRKLGSRELRFEATLIHGVI